MAKRRSAREKGKKLEKDTGILLGNWWRGQPFPRSHGSGSSKIECADGLVEAGDLHVPSDFPFCVECKNQQAWSLLAVLEGSCGLFKKWWKQTVDEAEIARRLPMLVVSKNTFGMYGVIKRDTGNVDWLLVFENRTMDIVMFKIDEGVVIMFKLEQFVLYPAIPSWVRLHNEETNYE